MRSDMHQLTSYIRLNDSAFVPQSFAEIGSRDGHDTAYVCNYWRIPVEQCYVFEAHPDCYKYIESVYPFSTHHVAITNETKKVSFNAGKVGQEKNVGISSLKERIAKDFIYETVEVNGWKYDDLIQHLQIEIPPQLLKVDVEGASMEVLQGMVDSLSDIAYIQIETEQQQYWEGQAIHDQVELFLQDHGFKLVDLIDLGGVQYDALFRRV